MCCFTGECAIFVKIPLGRRGSISEKVTHAEKVLKGACFVIYALHFGEQLIKFTIDITAHQAETSTKIICLHLETHSIHAFF
jgi:hypothetical protein